MVIKHTTLQEKIRCVQDKGPHGFYLYLTFTSLMWKIDSSITQYFLKL